MSDLHNELRSRKARFVRVDLDDEDQLVRFIRSGAIWRFPQYATLAIDAIESGLVAPEECTDLPSYVKDLL